MINGIAIFKCSECGKIFIAPAAEYSASAIVAPMPCLRCGSRKTMPLFSYFNPFSRKIYKEIWEQQSNNKY